MITEIELEEKIMLKYCEIKDCRHKEMAAIIAREPYDHLIDTKCSLFEEIITLCTQQRELILSSYPHTQKTINKLTSLNCAIMESMAMLSRLRDELLRLL